jgi:HSP20 family protein
MVANARGRRQSTSCARTAIWSCTPTCPGSSPKKVKIEVEDDLLTISGEHTESKEEKDKNYVRRERRYGSFSRSMTLPGGVDANKIKASTSDGVVELTIPLAKEAKTEAVRITPTAG